MKILFDADMLLEVLLNRNGLVEDAEKIWKLTQTRQIEAYITEIGLDKIYSFCSEMADNDVAYRIVTSIQAIVSRCSLNKNLMEMARLSKIDDFESAVELTCAKDMELDGVVTLSVPNFAGADFRVWMAKELLEVLKEKQKGKEILQKDVLTDLLVDSQLQPLENLSNNLNNLRNPQRLPVNLGRWFENGIEVGWQTIEELFGKPNLLLAFRNPKRVRRAKLLPLEMQLSSCSVALIIDLTQETDENIRIRVQIRSFNENAFLPEGLKLMVLDDTGKPFLDVSTGSSDRLIQTEQFHFVDQPEGLFTVQVVLGENSVTEDFVI
ncbi:DUF1822 family protein [Tolypothrix sp. FACHB-123]|uniref:DUF1822 family protein n=1 Tax=Tolypothrix sp. FACHB-123 TaxID=2692868 RepID=UPI00168570B6|nr:DUF1822 family protein [Tolypothrix sp. FACHB-123]MBD2358575.1 DUF1822 family protein [Tolypothrix sp. FACHB-123]